MGGRHLCLHRCGHTLAAVSMFARTISVAHHKSRMPNSGYTSISRARNDLFIHTADSIASEVSLV